MRRVGGLGFRRHLEAEGILQFALFSGLPFAMVSLVSGAATVQVAISRSLYRGVRTASARILFTGAPTSFSAPLTFHFCVRSRRPPYHTLQLP
jgi:hypothetical protein